MDHPPRIQAKGPDLGLVRAISELGLSPLALLPMSLVRCPSTLIPHLSLVLLVLLLFVPLYSLSASWPYTLFFSLRGWLWWWRWIWGGSRQKLKSPCLHLTSEHHYLLTSPLSPSRGGGAAIGSPQSSRPLLHFFFSLCLSLSLSFSSGFIGE